MEQAQEGGGESESKKIDSSADGKEQQTSENEQIKKDSTLAKMMQPSGDRSSSDEEEKVEVEELKADEASSMETVDFKVVYNKNKHDVTWPLDQTVLSLKHHIQTITNVAPAMQKLMFKGLAKDGKTLRDLGVTKGSKMMLVGSKLQDVISVNTVTPAASSSSEESSQAKREPLCKQKPHFKVIEKGLPEDAMPGYINGQEALPTTPLKGMVNKHGNKVRLTFKLEADQLWLGTKDRTEKIPLNSIKDVVSEKIVDNPGYHMLALQLGPTEQSRYWIYWVPAQYVEGIKDAVLGKWQLF